MELESTREKKNTLRKGVENSLEKGEGNSPHSKAHGHLQSHELNPREKLARLMRTLHLEPHHAVADNQLLQLQRAATLSSPLKMSRRTAGQQTARKTPGAW